MGLGSIANKASAYNRQRKWEIFQETINPTQNLRVLDVGFNAVEYSPVDNYLEKHYLWPENITALGIDDPRDFQGLYPQVKAVQYDGGTFPFEDGTFDICWSNAVIEHVGDRDAQRKFLSEIARVSRIAFITTPNRCFPIEVHTRTLLLHRLPKSLFDRYLSAIGKGWAAGEYMHLLSYGELVSLLDSAGITNYSITPNKLFGLSMDFVVVFGDLKH